MNHKTKETLKSIFIHTLLSLIVIICLFPVVWMCIISIKTVGESITGFNALRIANPTLANYKRLFELIPIWSNLYNSVFTSVIGTLTTLFFCSLAGYAFARLRFPGRDTLFMGYLATLMIPGQVVIIPNFILLRTIGWIDTYQALILPNAFSAFGTFLLRQFFMSLPEELEDAARIDGCGYLGIYWYVILPLSKPALTSLTIFTFLGQWNNFIWPLIVINSVEMNTLTVGLRTLQGQYNTAWTLLMAGSVLALLPILIMFFLGQRYFIKGVTLTGMGGR